MTTSSGLVPLTTDPRDPAIIDQIIETHNEGIGTILEPPPDYDD